MKFSLSGKNPTLPHYTIGKAIYNETVWGISTKSAMFFVKMSLCTRKILWMGLVCFFSCINKRSITYCFIYVFLLQDISGSPHQFLFGSLNVSCVLGAVNRPAELTADKLPLPKHCWEFDNNLLRPFWCFPLDLTTADFPHFFPEFYPAERMGL